MDSVARAFAGGHSEGYDDTFKQALRRSCPSLDEESAPVDRPRFADGVRPLAILDAAHRSAAAGCWPASDGCGKNRLY